MAFTRGIKKLAAIAISTVMCFSYGASFVAQNNVASAVSLSVGTICATSLRVRAGAGTTYTTLGYLYDGSSVTILGQDTAADGKIWYKIEFNGGTGYVSSQYVEVTGSVEAEPDTPAYTEDMDFEAYLDEQGFPESYKDSLRSLHAIHPNWVFKAQELDIDWSTALEAESQVGVSLVSKSSIASWKSMEKGAYNWNTNTWYGLDGASWVAASKELVAYYMDPRNFLDETSIFMFEQLSYDSSVHTIEGVQAILAGSFMSSTYTTPDTNETYSYAQTFMDAASATGVSPYHLASRARQEMGNNGTPLAYGTVPGFEGYYNFFNIQAYATSTLTAQQMGAKYASINNATYSLPWTNQRKALMGGSTFIGRSYINRGQDTLYLQKFDMVDGGNGYYVHQYMTNIQAAASEASHMKKAYNSEILNSALVFTIPIYDNMPDSACVKPTSTGTNNNFLSSISVKGYDVTPEFNRYTQSYSVTVPANVKSVVISATTNTSAALLSGTGAVELKTGNNTFTVTVTAPSGVKRNYTLNILREGDTMHFTYGDVNDDGFIDTVDTLIIMQYTAGNAELTPAQLLAADVNADGFVDVVDALMILQYNAGTIDKFV